MSRADIEQMTHDIHKAIADAREEVRRTKRVAPYLCPEYIRLQHAITKLQAAQKEYDDALRAWDRLGVHP